MRRAEELQQHDTCDSCYRERVPGDPAERGGQPIVRVAPQRITNEAHALWVAEGGKRSSSDPPGRFPGPMGPLSRSPARIASVGIPSGSPGHWRSHRCHALGSYPSAWLYRRPVAVPVGHRLPELAAGGDVELAEDLAQVVLDRALGQEQLGGDLRVGQAFPGQPRDLGLLGG